MMLTDAVAVPHDEQPIFSFPVVWGMLLLVSTVFLAHSVYMYCLQFFFVLYLSRRYIAPRDPFTALRD